MEIDAERVMLADALADCFEDLDPLLHLDRRDATIPRLLAVLRALAGEEERSALPIHVEFCRLKAEVEGFLDFIDPGRRIRRARRAGIVIDEQPVAELA